MHNNNNNVCVCHVKVELKPWCFLLPTSHIKTADGATMDPLSAVHDVFTARQLPDSMMVCTPELSIYSSGRMHANIVVDIPVKTVEHSIASKECLFLKLINSRFRFCALLTFFIFD